MNLFDLAFKMIDPSFPRKIDADHDLAVRHDNQTGQTVRTQNMKKRSDNTTTVRQWRQTHKNADIVWVFGPKGGYTHRIEVFEHNDGSRSGVVKAVNPYDHVIATYPDEISLEDLVKKESK